jgi:hypothetical protein
MIYKSGIQGPKKAARGKERMDGPVLCKYYYCRKFGCNILWSHHGCGKSTFRNKGK